MTRRALLVALLVVGVLVSAILVGCKEGAGTTPAAQSAAGQATQAQAKTGTESQAKTESEAGKGTESSSPEEQAKTLEDLGKSLPELSGQDLKDALTELTATAMTRDNSDKSRASAAGALAQLVGINDDATKTVTELAHDPSPTIRTAIARALVSPRGGAAAAGLLAALTKDPDPGVQAAAVESQATMLAASKAPGATGELIAELGNPVGDASAKAGYTLAAKGAEDPTKMLPYLSAAYTTSKNARQRAATMEVIAFICMGSNPTQEEFAAQAHATHVQTGNLHPAVPEGLPVMVQGLKDPDGYVREVAAQGLGYLGDERAAAPLAKALSDPDPFVRKRAASALVLVPGTEAMAALNKAALKDTDPDVRRYAVEAVGRINDPAAIQVLIAATRDPSEDVRRYAATELGRRHATEALDALIALCKDPDPDVRWQTVLAIGALQDKRATDALVNLLDDPAPQVSNAAERALQRLGIARRKEKYLTPATETESSG